MKTTFTIFLTSLCLQLWAGIPTIHAQDDPVDFDYFYDNLAPYGDWIEVEGYGYCFRPFVAAENPDWQPYSEGSWAETEAGWTWISEEEFGWATYHYGRWIYVDTFWAWVPGYEWAPAWVSWRTGGDYVGWAPLPPEAQWSSDRGFDSTVDVIYDIGPRYYNFIPIRYFGAVNCRPHLIDHHRNVTIIHETTNITHITYRQSDIRINRIHIGGPRYDDLSRHSEHSIRRLKLTQHRDRGDARNHHRDRIENGRFSVFAPSIVRKENRNIAPREVKMRANRDKVDRGWRGIDQTQATNIRQRIAEEKRPDSPRRDVNNNDRPRPERDTPVPSAPEQRNREANTPAPRMPRPANEMAPERNREREMPRPERHPNDNENRRRDMPTNDNRPGRNPSDQTPPGRVMPQPQGTQRDRPETPRPNVDRKPETPRPTPTPNPNSAPPNRPKAPAASERAEPRKPDSRQPRVTPVPQRQAPTPPQRPSTTRQQIQPSKQKNARPEAPQQARPQAPPSSPKSSPPPARAERREPERRKVETPAPQQRQPQARPSSPDQKPRQRGENDDRRQRN